MAPLLLVVTAFQPGGMQARSPVSLDLRQISGVAGWASRWLPRCHPLNQLQKGKSQLISQYGLACKANFVSSIEGAKKERLGRFLWLLIGGGELLIKLWGRFLTVVHTKNFSEFCQGQVREDFDIN